jgi:hypothetical protein
MQTIEQPNGRYQKRDDQEEKDYAAFAALLPKRTAARAWSTFAVAFVMQRHRKIKATAALARTHEQFFALTLFRFLGDARRLRDHALELLHLVAQLRFLTRQFLFRLIERSCRSRRTTKHAASPAG